MPNTHSLDLEASSSQFADVADNAAQSITGNISFEAYVKLETIASVLGHLMAIASKYNTTDGKRSYLFFLEADNKLTVNYSGDGASTNKLSSTSTITTTDAWIHLAATINVAAKSGTFYINGAGEAAVLTSDGGQTAIQDNNSRFAVGAYNTQGVAAGFSDMKVDEVRIYNAIVSGANILSRKDQELVGDEAGLLSYYKFNNDYTDSDDVNNNTLTPSGGPVFSTDIPFGLAGGNMLPLL